MIAPHHFREALGLTQEETAMLLRIPLSQLAMFEIGQRDLPTDAKLKLANMYHHVQNKQKEIAQLPALKVEEAKMIKIVEEELLVNQHEQVLIERKINTLKSKYQKSVSILQLVEYLETQLPKQEQYEKEFTAILRRKALKGIEKNGLPIQTPLNLKLTGLQLHQKELQRELNKINTIF